MPVATPGSAACGLPASWLEFKRAGRLVGRLLQAMLGRFAVIHGLCGPGSLLGRVALVDDIDSDESCLLTVV